MKSFLLRLNSLFSFRRLFFIITWKKKRLWETTTHWEENQDNRSVSYPTVNIPWTDQIVKTGIKLVFAIRSGQKVVGVDWFLATTHRKDIRSCSRAAWPTRFLFGISLWNNFEQKTPNPHRFFSGSCTSKTGHSGKFLLNFQVPCQIQISSNCHVQYRHWHFYALKTQNEQKRQSIMGERKEIIIQLAGLCFV